MVSLVPWTRKHRSLSEGWRSLPDNLPPAWFVYPAPSGPRFSWAVLRSGCLVGRLTLRDCTPTSAILGLYLIPRARGAGVGRAVLTSLLERRLLGLTWVYADVCLENVASMRLFQALGWPLVAYEDREWDGRLYRYALFVQEVGCSIAAGGVTR